MAKFRKKPVEIEAFQWDGDSNCLGYPEWFVELVKANKVFFEYVGTPEAQVGIETLEGTMRASIGDWIIKGIKGEVYPCKPDIFEATYELVEIEKAGS